MVIGPVVEDVSEQVNVGRDTLLREEIMHHEFNPAGDIGRDRFFRATNHLRAVLHDEFEPGAARASATLMVPAEPPTSTTVPVPSPTVDQG